MKTRSFILLGIIIVSISVMWFYTDTSDTSNHLLRADTFMEKFKSVPDAVLVDVRTSGEFASGHIEGAINIDFHSPSFLSDFKKLDPTKMYFVYCRSGNRSGQAAALLGAHGFSSVYDLSEGIMNAPQLLE